MAKQAPITIPTEPIGSIPRPVDLIERVAKGDSEDPDLAPLYEDAIRDTIERFEATGSPVVTDGEQRKYHNFATYCIHGLPNTAPDGFKIAFSDGHTRRLSRLTRGPFRYRRYADSTHSGDMGYDARLRGRGAGAGQSCRRFPLCPGRVVRGGPLSQGELR